MTKDMEEFTTKIFDEFFQEIGGSLAKAVGVIVYKAYAKGFENCKKFYRIDDDKFLKEQEEAARYIVGVDVGDPKGDVGVETKIND